MSLPVSWSVGQEVIVFAWKGHSFEKNLPNMLAALELAFGKRKNAVALLFGAGPQKEQLEELKATLSNGARIVICDFTSELWGVLKRANVFLSVSTHEGHPNAGPEAVALGCPVLTLGYSESSGVSER